MIQFLPLLQAFMPQMAAAGAGSLSSLGPGLLNAGGAFSPGPSLAALTSGSEGVFAKEFMQPTQGAFGMSAGGKQGSAPKVDLVNPKASPGDLGRPAGGYQAPKRQQITVQSPVQFRARGAFGAF